MSQKETAFELDKSFNCYGDATEKKKRGGLYCVCCGHGRVSCTNSAITPGISMHKFPNK